MPANENMELHREPVCFYNLHKLTKNECWIPNKYLTGAMVRLHQLAINIFPPAACGVCGTAGVQDCETPRHHQRQDPGQRHQRHFRERELRSQEYQVMFPQFYYPRIKLSLRLFSYFSI